MSDILLLEPASIDKRRGYADKLINRAANTPINRDQLKKRLKDIRLDSVKNMTSYAHKLKSRLNESGQMNVSFASNAEEAVETIKKISDNRNIAINKSAVVANELMPGLKRSGFDIVETYYHELKEFDNQFNIFKHLPNLDISSIFNSFQVSGNLSDQRKTSVLQNGSKKMLGLIGLNALSVEDGTISMLQHLGNISKVVCESQQLIFVAGIDKLVKNASDAMFQTKCMASFGWETLPSPKTFYSGQGGGTGIRHIKRDISPENTDLSIHLILLDNGRSNLATSDYSELLTCIGCRACLKSCPSSQYFQNENRWNPREYLTYYVHGRQEKLDRCLQCRTCRTHCPVDIDIPGMILEARFREFEEHQFKIDNAVFSNIDKLVFMGSKTPEISNQLAENKIARNVGEWVASISRKRKLPKFGKVSFDRWFENRFRLESLRG